MYKRMLAIYAALFFVGLLVAVVCDYVFVSPFRIGFNKWKQRRLYKKWLKEHKERNKLLPYGMKRI